MNSIEALILRVLKDAFGEATVKFKRKSTNPDYWVNAPFWILTESGRPVIHKLYEQAANGLKSILKSKSNIIPITITSYENSPLLVSMSFENFLTMALQYIRSNECEWCGDKSKVIH